MIVVSIAGILLSILAGAMNNNNSGQAEHDAKAFVTKMYGATNANASCMDRDTDNNGYVSCTVVYDKANGEQVAMPLECGANFSWNTGCKMAMPVYNVR